MVRIFLYFLDNIKYIIEVKDPFTKIKYDYTSVGNKGSWVPSYKYFYINIENVPINGLISYNIYEPFNSIKYKYSLKFYDNYNISELPKAYQIRNFDYESDYNLAIEEEPMMLIRKKFDYKGLFLQIETKMSEDNEENINNEMIVYLYPKNIFNITENEKLNYTQLLKKNVFYFSNPNNNLFMKSNLDYFTLLYPERKIIKSKSYLFHTNLNKNNFTIFELQISENALIELQFVNKTKIDVLTNPDFMYLCENDIREEKYIYLPYMTNFNVLFGSVDIFEIISAGLTNVDDIFSDNYLLKYNNSKRYDNYYKNKDEQYFYKLSCLNYSLLKFEDSFVPNLDEDITLNNLSQKIILDFSIFNKKKITFESNLTLYIGIVNELKLNRDENLTLNISFNKEDYSINLHDQIFFKEVIPNDILIIKKPDKNIYVYIKPIFNYNTQTIQPLNTKNSNLFIFEKNISEKYNILISLSNYGSSYGKIGLFYDNPNNYENNQLISHDIEIPINPYKYLKEEEKDETKYFFIVYQSFKSNEMNIIKLTNINVKLNELFYISKIRKEYLNLKLPKSINETKVVAFIQYFGQEIDIYNKEKKLPYNYSFYQYRVYIFDTGMEPYYEDKSSYPFGSYYYISYMNYQYFNDSQQFIMNQCHFRINSISDSIKRIEINIHNECNSTVYKYWVFFEKYNSKYTYTPIQLLYEKN